MTNKLGVLAAELRRCQEELYYLGMEDSTVTNRRKLIISTGDISDVDGFFALAEYAKTGQDVLFIMNYPNYVQKETATYEECVTGLGFVYDADTYRTESERSIVEKVGSNSPSFINYQTLLRRYVPSNASATIAGNFNVEMKNALTDLAFFMAHRVWKEAGGNPVKLFFCIGGVNSVNPFAASQLKNELFVYADVIMRGNAKKLGNLKEGSIINNEGTSIRDGRQEIKQFIDSYQELYIDFNGSMAFFDTEWASCLTRALSKNAVRGVFVAGGVYSDQEAKTMPSIEGQLNRFSCATMNQLYHPCNTYKFFDLMHTFNANVVMITNNQVDSIETKDGDIKTDDGWKAFLSSNKISSDFMISISNAYYNSIYNPPRKPFDFYTARALVAVLNGTVLITRKRTLHYNSVYGSVIVGRFQSSWKSALKEYIDGIDTQPKDGDSGFIKNKKKKFVEEIELLKTLSCGSMTVSIPEAKLSKPSFILELRMYGMAHRDAKSDADWFIKKFGTVYTPGNNNMLEGVPIFFKLESDMNYLPRIMGYSVLQEWIVKIKSSFILNCIVIQSVDMFGSRMGFIKFQADVFDYEGLEIPSVVFMRGGSVCVLVVIECENRLYTILTNQARIPVGMELLEIPAGMLDGDGNFAGVAAKEIKEETGIEIHKQDLVDLTKEVYGELYGTKLEGVFPSAGGCDEFMRMFLYKTTMAREKLDELQGRQTGVSEEGEKIKVKVIPFGDLARTAPDMKALSALTLYEQYNKMQYRKTQQMPGSSSDWRRLVSDDGF